MPTPEYRTKEIKLPFTINNGEQRKTQVDKSEQSRLRKAALDAFEKQQDKLNDEWWG